MNTKLLTLIYSLLIISILSTRVLREEANWKDNDNDSHEEEKEDGEEIENNEQTDFSKISSSKIRKENMPHSRVLLPIRRMGT